MIKKIKPLLGERSSTFKLLILFFPNLKKKKKKKEEVGSKNAIKAFIYLFIYTKKCVQNAHVCIHACKNA